MVWKAYLFALAFVSAQDEVPAEEPAEEPEPIIEVPAFIPGVDNLFEIAPNNEDDLRDEDQILYRYYEYKQQFGCGECIARGYNYCWKAVVPG